MAALPKPLTCPHCGKLYSFPGGDECACGLSYDDEPTAEESPPPRRGGDGFGFGMLALTAVVIGALAFKKRGR